MKIHSKAVIAILAVVLSAPFALAQDPQQGPGPEQMGPPDPQGGGPQFIWRQRFVGQGDEDGNVRWGGGNRGWGRGGGMGMDGRGQGRRGFMLAKLVNNPDIRQKLGITDEQAAKIRQQFSDFRIAEVRNQADVEVKRIELRDLLSADNPDKAAIDSKIDEIGAARLAGAKARVDFGLSMKDALTPDQRAKLKDMMSHRFGEHDRDGFRGPHHPHPMGPGGQSTPPAAPDGQAPANPPAGPGSN